MNTIAALFFLACFILFILKSPFFSISGIKKKYIAGGFLLKVLAGVILYLIYTRYYPERHLADIFKYYDDGSIMYSAFTTAPEDYFRMLFGIGDYTPYFIENYYSEMIAWNKSADSILIDNNYFIIRFNAFLHLISFQSYWAHVVTFCFISYCGIIALVRFFASILPAKTKLFFWSSILIPSLLIWTSGILKEGFLIFGIGLTLYSFSKIQAARKFIFPAFLWGILGLLILFLNKVSFFAIFSFPLLFYYAFIFLKDKIKPVFVLSGLLFIIAGCYLFAYFVLDIKLFELLAFKRNDFIRLSDAMNASSYIPLKPIENPWQLYAEIPCSLWRAVWHPSPIAASNLLHLFSGLENWGYLLLLLMPFIFFDKQNSIKNIYLLLFIAFFLMLYLTIIGFTTPVAGAIIRYKSIILPLYLSGIIILTDFKKIKEVKIHKKLSI